MGSESSYSMFNFLLRLHVIIVLVIEEIFFNMTSISFFELPLHAVLKIFNAQLENMVLVLKKYM